MAAASERQRGLGGRGRRRTSGEVTPEASTAREAGLVYVTDSGTGYRRRRRGRGFEYRDHNNALITDREQLDRIRRLAVPPAWTDVWICPHPRGHIQATGRDARHRKQYRYHTRWQQFRDRLKYGRLLDFADVLPRLRRQLKKDLARRDLSRERVVAAAVNLLETTRMRVGNEEYAQSNGSYGLTTLRDQHVRVTGDQLRFRFRGKSGKEHEITVRDRRLARLVSRCAELPGQHLFQYLDGAGSPQSIESADVNDYIRDVTGGDFTAKDFRTWSGSVLALRALVEQCDVGSQAEAEKNLIAAIDCVAEELGNTRAVCRRSYVHPSVIESYLDGCTLREVKQTLEASRVRPAAGLDASENLLVLLLRHGAREAAQCAA
jgi:DNA topoisomerase-1